MAASRIQSVTLNCERCDEVFHPINGRAKTMRFCSPKCRDDARRKPLRSMSPVEIAWLAGVFDGEGCIQVNAQLSPRAHGVKIQVTNTCRPLVDEVLRVTGVGFITTRYHQSEKHKPTHDWHTTGGNAEEILRLLSPLLIAKKARTSEALRQKSR